jgi:hypothetical protein
VILLPLIFFLAVWIGRQFTREKASLRQSVAAQAQVLLPLGLMAWIAFTVSFAFPKLNLILGVMNDPFGWGWKLLDPIKTAVSIDLSNISVVIQVVLLLVGMFWSASVSRKLTLTNEKYQNRLNIPVLLFSLIFTIVMFWLLIG